MLYVLKKEQVQHAQLRALAQAIIAKEKGQEVFEEYMRVAFPWLETHKRRERADHVQLLLEEVKKGGLTVRPVAQGQSKSRMKTRIIERTEEQQRQQVAPRSKKDLDSLYTKLGKAPLT